MYLLGHKCKKMGSNYLIVLVDEDQDTTEYNFCSENHPLADALHAFDNSLKRNTCIKSDEWFREGQENPQEGSEVASCEQLGGLNPPNRLLERSTSHAHDKLASNAQQEQQGNVHQLFDEMPMKITVSNLDEQSESGEVYFKLDHISTCKQLEISALPSKLL